MKTSSLLLISAAACGLALSSCVVDPYGYPVAGVGHPAATYSSVSYFGPDPYFHGGYGCNSGFSPFYAPLSTNFTYFGGRNFGNNCYRPGFASAGRIRNGSHLHQRSVSSSHHYASQVTRPSTFRGSSVFSSPPLSPSIGAPRTLSRPSVRSAPIVSPGRTFGAPSAAPSRSFGVPSQPRPSGRSERPSPGVASFSAPSSSIGTMSAVSASSGRFESLPSDMRRSR